MPVNDPIADLLTRLRNAQHARRVDCVIPWSTIKQSICELLKTKEFVADVAVEGEKSDKMIRVTFSEAHPELSLKRISTPGGRKYVGTGDVRSYMHGASMAIISTSHGLMTDQDARQKHIGGELLCTVA